MHVFMSMDKWVMGAMPKKDWIVPSKCVAFTIDESKQKTDPFLRFVLLSSNVLFKFFGCTNRCVNQYVDVRFESKSILCIFMICLKML